MDYFTSDLHINHANILTLGHRPFKDLPEMHETLISNWNGRVTSSDVVYVLGDLALGNIKDLEPIVNRLNGTIVLVKGNHDRSPRKLMEACPSIKLMYNYLHMTKYIGDKGYRVFMRHHPPSDPKTWETNWRADTFLCGHVHSSWSKRSSVINVGVDVRGYTPATFEELIRTPPIAEKPREDQCRVCGFSLTVLSPTGERSYTTCPKHPQMEM